MLACTVSSAFAESVKTTEMSTNGVSVTVYSDAFAGRAEYSAPSIEFQVGDSYSKSFALVAYTKRAATNGPLVLVGSIYYRGDWHYYNSAIFKGGDSAEFTNTSRDVISCRRGCSYSEGFRIVLTPEVVAKYMENGVLPIQIQAQRSSDDPIIEIPKSYIDAVIEVSKCDTCILKPKPVVAVTTDKSPSKPRPAAVKKQKAAQ
jgi:hypothetical protein